MGRRVLDQDFYLPDISLLVFFWNAKEILLEDFLKKAQTIIDEYERIFYRQDEEYR